jgi:hypothetical protein
MRDSTGDSGNDPKSEDQTAKVVYVRMKDVVWSTVVNKAQKPPREPKAPKSFGAYHNIAA